MKHDLTTFSGRFWHFVEITDPRTLLNSRETEDYAKSLVTALNDPAHSDRLNSAWKPNEIANFKKIVDSAFNPGTGENILKPFRVSAIAPVNIPIVFAMLACPASNVPGTLFLHWLNQSYNTACNYANRSGATQSTTATVKAYLLAVSSACGFAYGLGKVVERSPSLRNMGAMSALIPCLATSAANCSNIGFTRASEITEGTPVYDDEGKVRGVSKKAGFSCVLQTALTRCILVPCSCLLLPPLALTALRMLKATPKSKFALMATELTFIYLSLQGALPAALAVFPQEASFDVSDLEPEFSSLQDSTGSPVLRLKANKGL